MLRIEPRIPIYFAVVEAEYTILFADLDVHVIWAGQNLVPECPVGGRGADVVGFVDYGAHGGVFVDEDGRDEVLVGEVGGAEV